MIGLRMHRLKDTPLEVVDRYRALGEIIRSLGVRHSSFLDVGCSGSGLNPILDRPFAGVDTDLSRPNVKTLIKIGASAERLPFQDNTFEVATSIDALDWLSPRQRFNALREMVRVSARHVVVGLPLGKGALEFDRELYAFGAKRLKIPLKKNRNWLTIHETHGLPKKQEVVAQLRRIESIRFRVREKGNLYFHIMATLTDTLFTPRISRGFSRTRRVFYGQIRSAYRQWHEILKRTEFGPSYRTFFIITKKGSRRPLLSKIDREDLYRRMACLDCRSLLEYRKQQWRCPACERRFGFSGPVPNFAEKFSDSKR